MTKKLVQKTYLTDYKKGSELFWNVVGEIANDWDCNIIKTSPSEIVYSRDTNGVITYHELVCIFEGCNFEDNEMYCTIIEDNCYE